MAKKFFHKQSKRLTCRHKYKVEKKVRDHNKKMKKNARKNPNSVKKKKDPGVPNSLPFKEAILQEAERRKQLLLEQKMKLREERKMAKKNQTLEELKNDAEKRDENFDENEIETMTEVTTGLNDYSTKTYYKEFRKVVEDSDVVLQVLDARDPLGSRCPQVEKSIIDAGPSKRLVLVLNKIDLIPKENLQKWLKYLRNEFPTIAFKSSRQLQNQNLCRNKMNIMKVSKMPNLSVCFGADMLIKLLGNYCRNKGIRTSIRVGVVGFPNVGKSSLINSLKRSKACSVGATPGLTKTVQLIQLDKHISLLDSPGIIMASGKPDDVSIALKNAVKVECIEDPIAPCQAIFQRSSKEQLMMHYSVQEFNTLEMFLALLAKKRGMLKKGGVPDLDKAAKTVIIDWNVGKIKYYTHPPENSNKASYISSKVVSEMSKEFDIEALLSEEKEDLKGLKTISDVEGMVIESSGPTEANEDIETEDMTVDEPKVTVSMSKKQAKQAKVESKTVDDPLRANATKKKEFKKLLKKRRRNDKLATALSDTLLSSMALSSTDGNDSYDFSTDYK